MLPWMKNCKVYIQIRHDSVFLGHQMPMLAQSGCTTSNIMKMSQLIVSKLEWLQRGSLKPELIIPKLLALWLDRLPFFYFDLLFFLSLSNGICDNLMWKMHFCTSILRRRFIWSNHLVFMINIIQIISACWRNPCGLKQASRAWFDRLSQILLHLGFNCSNSDSSLSFYTLLRLQLCFLLKSNDVLVVGNDSSLIQTLVDQLACEFAIKDLGPLHYFLGMGSNTFLVVCFCPRLPNNEYEGFTSMHKDVNTNFNSNGAQSSTNISWCWTSRCLYTSKYRWCTPISYLHKAGHYSLCQPGLSKF